MLIRALDQTEDLMSATGPDDLALQTPCADYDVQTLLGHLLTVAGRIDLALSGADPLVLPQVTTADDVLGTWKERRAKLDATLADDAVLARTCKVPWGTVPGAAAAAGYVGELTMHAWDLAKALGRQEQLDDELAVYVLPLMQRALPEHPRGGPIPFGPVVPVADDASPYDRLAAWEGRQP
ncbi:TIGR03086 family protein [Kribbella sandramycini]|nr:TIGR03086 family protein [Kribbella sandramycini]